MASEAKLKQMLLKSVRDINAARARPRTRRAITE